MLTAYIALSVVIGLFFTYWWSSDGALNSSIKVFWTLYTIAGVVAMLSQFPLVIAGTNIRVF